MSASQSAGSVALPTQAPVRPVRAPHREDTSWSRPPGLEVIEPGDSSLSPECSDLHGLQYLPALNGVSRLDRFLADVNERLEIGDVFVGRAETNYQRRERWKREYSTVAKPLLGAYHFVFYRVFPRLGPTRRVSEWLSRRVKRSLSLTELLGRLVHAGFEIVTFRAEDGLTVFNVRKERPVVAGPKPTYGLMVGLERTGKDGRPFMLLKIRSMHPYAEFLQEFAYAQSGLKNGDKIVDDFRVTQWGMFLRKYWIDELPMLWHLVTGEVKLIGVRPLSRHKLSLYAEDLREQRLCHKPGLVPPFYADMPDSFEELQDSERRYLEAHEKAPLRTDLRYGWKAFVNIVFRGVRSA